MRSRSFGGGVAALLVVLSASSSTAGPDAALVRAVKARDAAAIEKELRQPADVNEPGTDGSTALHWAVHQDDRALVGRLLQAGARADAVNRYGVAPIALAAENGNAEILTLLLDAGARVDTAQPGGETPLMTAARTGQPAAVRLLLGRGADVKAREATRQQTALMWAAARGNTEVVKALIAAGADVHARSKDPAPARANAKPVMLSFTPLLFAVRAGHIDAVRALLDAGANANDKTDDGYSALMVATLNAHWELGALLLERNADPNAADQGWTALHQVARTRTLDSGGQLAPPTPTGRLSSLDFAKKLIDHGANINARMTKDSMDGYQARRFRREGSTPLLAAAKGADPEMMRLLLANGADIHIRTRINSTVLMTAAGLDFQYLDEDSGTPEGALECVRIALEAGDDVNGVNDNGDTALHGAAFRGHPPIIQLLTDEGAKLDARNKYGFTPLWVAHAYISIVVTHRAEAEELLVKLMKQRGLPTDVISVEETIRRLRREKSAGANTALLARIDELLNTRDVEIVTDYATVTLRGRVPSVDAHDQVLGLVREAPGVEHVVDELEVKP